MSTTYGFYDSEDGDRKYTATQLGELISGMITDGVFPTIGDKFVVNFTDYSYKEVIVGSGKAWFNNTFIEVYPNEILKIPNNLSDFYVIIEISHAERVNRLKITEEYINNPGIYQYPIAHVTISETPSATIQYMIGTPACPFAESLSGVSEDDVVKIISENDLTTKNINATAQKNTITYSNIKPYTTSSGSQKFNIKATGTNTRGDYDVGVSLEANTSEASSTEAKIAVGRFDRPNLTGIDAFSSGLYVDERETTICTNRGSLQINDDKNDKGVITAHCDELTVRSRGLVEFHGTSFSLELGYGGDQCLQAGPGYTKIRTSGGPGVSYIQVDKSGIYYASTSHRFFNEDESTFAEIKDGTLWTEGQECYFAKAYVVEGGKSIALKSVVDYTPFFVTGRGVKKGTEGKTASGLGGLDQIVYTYKTGSDLYFNYQTLTSSAIWYSISATLDGMIITPKTDHTLYITVIGPCIVKIM